MKRRKFFLMVGGAGMAFATQVQSATQVPAGKTQQAEFARAMQAIERQAGGRLGVAVLNIGTGAAWGWRHNERFPMCSTFKMLLAGQVLAEVDAGREQLESEVQFDRSALVENSPVTEQHAEKSAMTVAQLCDAIVTRSDNAAANLLLARLGGPPAFTHYMRSLGDASTRLDRIEPAMSESRPGDLRDTTTPLSMLTSMQTLTLGKALTPRNRKQLVDWMLACKTGDNCLRAGAKGWVVADKTGAGPGTRNDVGLLWPPGGGAPILVTCYLTETSAAAPARDAAIAGVAAQLVKQMGPV